MNVFFTCKNTLVILLQLYRLYVVHSENNKPKKKSTTDFELTDISIISKMDMYDTNKQKRRLKHRYLHVVQLRWDKYKPGTRTPLTRSGVSFGESGVRPLLPHSTFPSSSSSSSSSLESEFLLALLSHPNPISQGVYGSALATPKICIWKLFFFSFPRFPSGTPRVFVFLFSLRARVEKCSGCLFAFNNS